MKEYSYPTRKYVAVQIIAWEKQAYKHNLHTYLSCMIKFNPLQMKFRHTDIQTFTVDHPHGACFTRNNTSWLAISNGSHVKLVGQVWTIHGFKHKVCKTKPLPCQWLQSYMYFINWTQLTTAWVSYSSVIQTHNNFLNTTTNLHSRWTRWFVP